MSEREGPEKKMEEEKIILDHFSHDHPLILTEIGRSRAGKCSGCLRYIFASETAYKCSNGCRSPILHEECAEMPIEMTLSIHPQHTLIQKQVKNYQKCAVCDGNMRDKIGYCCSSGEDDFQVHVGCAQNTAVMHAAAGGERSRKTHPSHPHHELTLLWRPGRACSLRCDACATVHRGNSYVCIVCQYCINESCAALPATATYDHHHHHPLFLAYHLPLEYIKFKFKCDICYKNFLLPRYWVYHCAICRYVVHINCAIQTSPASTSNIDVNAEVIAFPIDNNKAVEELITPFIMEKLGRSISINTPHDNNEMVKGKYKFHNHDHELTLISSSSSTSLSLRDIEEEEEEKKNSDDDDDDLNFGNQLKTLVCDGCTLPIKCSSSSNDYYYMSCGECKYFLHWECFHLPPDLPSHPLHLEPDHNLTLQTPPKLDLTWCSICWSHTNGLFYGCTECGFKADIKCASLPDTIKHASHLQHHLKLITAEITNENSYWERFCVACGRDTIFEVCYGCDICEIIMHAKCVSLPATVANPVWDKHPLPLTFDASVDHPSGFYCDICEEEMNPKRGMYHCRRCDFSLHPRCFPNASGEFRSIKFGQRYTTADHRHPVVYQLMSTRLRCSVCGNRKDFGSRGFQCHSHKCEFFMCFHPCGVDRLDSMKAVD